MSVVVDRELNAFLRLKEKLHAIAINAEAHKELSSKPFDATTNNHHYIPKHFIDGFLNQDGLVWRYDKKKDRIIKNPQGSKGVFFKERRNSLIIDDETAVPIFEHYYTIQDNLFPIAIKLLRGNKKLDAEIMTELYDHLNIFFIDLYWRNINTDPRFDQLYEAAKEPTEILGIANPTVEQLRAIKNIPGYKQLSRIRIVHESMKAALAYRMSTSISNALVTYDQPQFCLGDMPYITLKPPSDHSDLLSLPLIMPISSNKIYIRNLRPERRWNPLEAGMINAMIVDQSSEMIVCPDRGLLELAVRNYHKAKDLGLLGMIKARTFQFRYEPHAIMH